MLFDFLVLFHSHGLCDIWSHPIILRVTLIVIQPRLLFLVHNLGTRKFFLSKLFAVSSSLSDWMEPSGKMDPETQKIEDVMSKPIPGPSHVGPDHKLHIDYNRPLSTMLIIGRFFADLVRQPVFWWRENVVEANRGPKYYWYHKKYPRALPVDECYVDDLPCIYEAHLEYERTRKVDRATLDLLRWRRDNCWYWHQTNIGEYTTSEACDDISKTFDREETNYHTKYGDLHHNATVIHAYNKQKHRMIVDRRRAQKETVEREEA